MQYQTTLLSLHEMASNKVASAEETGPFTGLKCSRRVANSQSAPSRQAQQPLLRERRAGKTCSTRRTMWSPLSPNPELKHGVS